ncbi:hypothetical protein FDENT_8076 [Fusarium denticulatum]|uniref:Uncharacterized protein n=1 Tax=Fusarium denticulatum TaxID=48507 RepID=A0A8H5U2G7_9HYPO|nr:hypothetical protein FDENT_8076 [Fusarium denticulatum]
MSMSKNAKHVIAVASNNGWAYPTPSKERLSPILMTSVPSTIRTSGQVERSTVLATWAPLLGYSTLPHVADSKTQKHREEKEPKNMSAGKGELSHRARLWE